MMPEQHIEMIVEDLDAAEMARARARGERFQRNLAWFSAHALEIGDAHRGKCICIAGEELFVADTPEQALALAKAAHPEDDGPFIHYIYRERMPRIYDHQRLLDPAQRRSPNGAPCRAVLQ
jgi:hypothetical protein